MAVVAERKKVSTQKIEKQKDALVKKVLSIKDENTVALLLSYYQELAYIKRISKAQYNKEMEEAEKRVKAGKFLTNEQVMKAMKKW